MKTAIDLGVFAVTVLMMVCVGMEVEFRRFGALARSGSRPWILLLAQAVFLPVLAVLLTRGLALPSHLGAGILLLAACPVGDVANVYAVLARANVALSLALNALSCLGAVATMAVVFAVYERWIPGGFDLAAPAPAIVLRTFAMVVLPVSAGMFIRARRPGFVARHRRGMHRATIAGIGILAAYVAGSRWEQLVAEWRQAAVAGMLFVGAALGTGWGTALLLGLGREDRITSAIVFAARNVGLASAIAITTLGRIEYAVFALVYFLAEIPLLLVYARLVRPRSDLTG